MQKTVRTVLLTLTFVLLGACATVPPAENLAIGWVARSAEYRAATTQVYQAAAMSLPLLQEHAEWSALPGVPLAAGAPPAIILDVDETVLDNSPFEVRYDGAFTPETWDAWIAERSAAAVPGSVRFLRAAQQQDIELFYVTNRRCTARAGNPDPCPQHTDTLANLKAAGVPVEGAHLMLRDGQPGWGSEKSVRRQHIATAHRVIMLFGDDLGDFLPCVRAEAVEPCSSGSTAAQRSAAVSAHRDYWGSSWFVLPNPMYGSWTAVQ